MNYEEFVEFISNLNPNHCIGIHGVTGEGNYLVKAISIMSQGLNIKGWGGILSSVTIFGKVKDLTEKDYQRMYDYVYSADNDGNIANIVFAFPESLTTEEGKEYYLGSFKPTVGYAKGDKEAGDNLPLNNMVEQNKLIPKEFIVGYFLCKMETENFTFFENPMFFENITAFVKQIEEDLRAGGAKTLEEARNKIGFLKAINEKFHSEYLTQLIKRIEQPDLNKGMNLQK